MFCHQIALEHDVANLSPSTKKMNEAKQKSLVRINHLLVMKNILQQSANCSDDTPTPK